MAGDPTQGLVLLPSKFSTSVGTLAAGAALNLETGYASGNTTRRFVMRQVAYSLGWDTVGVAGAGVLIVGVCRGDADTAEIKAALETSLPDPDDVSTWDSYANLNIIVWKTLRAIYDSDTGSDTVLNETISVGGKKGIPFPEQKGFKAFIYNPASVAITTGTGIDGIINYRGVWVGE